MYFGSYEVIQRMLVPEGGDRSNLGVFRTLFAGNVTRLPTIVEILKILIKKINKKSNKLYFIA